MLVAGRYELHEVLGRGSMGTVYRGRDVVLDRPVALKLFPVDSIDDERAARYEQEARLLARLSHPALVTVFDVGIDRSDAGGGAPYLVMQLIAGTTLAGRIAAGPMPSGEVTALGMQLSSALAHIHDRGIVHRDIKPANILLTPADEPGAGDAVTLTDFGIARLIDGTRITTTGFTLGTANYLSPEQLNGEDVGPPSDIYSLGLVLLECLTGEVAYPGYGVEAALPRLRRAPVIPKWMPAGWTQLLRATTDLRPATRPTAGDVWRALSGIEPAPAQGRSGTVALAPPVATRPAAPWLFIAAMLVLVVVSTAALAFAPGGSGIDAPAAPDGSLVPARSSTDQPGARPVGSPRPAAAADPPARPVVAAPVADEPAAHNDHPRHGKGKGHGKKDH